MTKNQSNKYPFKCDSIKRTTAALALAMGLVACGSGSKPAPEYSEAARASCGSFDMSDVGDGKWKALIGTSASGTARIVDVAVDFDLSGNNSDPLISATRDAKVRDWWEASYTYEYAGKYTVKAYIDVEGLGGNIGNGFELSCSAVTIHTGDFDLPQSPSPSPNHS